MEGTPTVFRHVRYPAVVERRRASHVSILLGHSSVRITERHYSPWVKARQGQLEADVRLNWVETVDEAFGHTEGRPTEALSTVNR